MKNKRKMVIFIGLLFFIVGFISVGAATLVFNSNEVSYDNSASNVSSTNVQDAIDELYASATTYNEIDTKITSLETALSTLQTNFSTLQTNFNNFVTSNAYSVDTYTTSYGTIKVVAEKRANVVTVTVRGVTGDPLTSASSMVVLATLPAKYRPAGVDGSNSKIRYVPVHKKYRMQFYVNPAGQVMVGYTHNDETNTDENYPGNYGMYASMTYVTNQ